MEQQVVFGKVAFTPKGEWQSKEKYERYDMTYKGTCIYISLKDENKAALDDKTAWLDYFNVRVTTDMITDEAITNEKLKDGLISWAKLDDNVKNIIASREEGGIALANELGNSKMIGISQWKLTEEITDIKGQVGSIADEEDLTVVKKAGLTKQVELKLKDKAYDPDVHSGMGRKYLRKNNVVVGGIPFMGIVENVNAAEGDEEEIIDEVFFDRVRERFVGAIVSLDPTTQAKSYSFLMQWEDYGTMAYSLYVPISSSRMYDLNGVPYKWSGSDLVVYDGADRGEKVKNVLTQAMLQDADGHNLENTIFHIQYDYTLDGESIEVPAGSILLFEGGSISNGTLTGDFTVVKAIGTEVFHNVTLPGNVESIDKEVADLKAMDNDLSGRIAEEANRAMSSETNLQQGIGGLDSRLQQVEGLAELSVKGGQIGIASATDFTNRTTEGDLKIPTVGAILNAADEEPTDGSDNLVKSGGVATKLNHINKEINGIPELNLSYNIENNEAFSVNHDVLILAGVYNLVCDNSVDGRTYLRFYYKNESYHQVINITNGWSGQVSFTDDIVGVRFQTLDFVSGGVVSLNIVSGENSLTKRISSLESDNTINKNDIADIKNDIDRIDFSISGKDNSKEYSFEITRNESYESKREIDVKAGKYKLSYTNSVVGTTYVRLYKMDKTYKQYKLTEQGEISLDIAEDYTMCAFQTISFESSGLIILSFDDLEKTDGVTSEIVTELNIKINDALTKCDTLIYDAKLLNDRAYASEYKSGFSLQLDSPKIIFIFDDAVANTSDVLDVFKTKNKIFCEATPSNTLNNVAKDGRTIKNVLLELQNLGGEVISHSINGTPLDTMTYDECENALRKSRIDLENAGFEINGWVSPNNNFASIAERLYPKYYLYGVGAAPSSSRLQNLHFTRTALTTLAEAKTMVNWAVSNNSYRIFTSHMRDTDLANFSLSDLAELLDYCDEQSVEIITMKTLYFNYGRNA